MLARRRPLRLGNREVGETPLVVPAFSSRGFSEIAEILRLAAEFVTESALVSAYDIYHRKLGRKPDLTFVQLLFLDSGGYETAERADLSDLHYSEQKPKHWSRELLAQVLDGWPVGPDSPVTVAVSYDETGRPLADQVRAAEDLFGGRDGFLKELIVKPEKQSQLYIQPASVVERVGELSSFDVVGFTEKELGNSVLQRMERIAMIRTELDRAGVDVPIHVFGGLDTLSAPLYYVAGAEIFDGLSWLRFAYRDGMTIYKRNYGAFELGIHAKDRNVETRCWAHNVLVLEGLELEMKAFQVDGDFGRFKHNSGLIERAHHDLCAKLGRDL